MANSTEEFLRMVLIIDRAEVLLREVADLSDEAISEGDPALIGSFRDTAKDIIRAIDMESKR